MLYVVIKIVCDNDPEFVFIIIKYLYGNRTEKLKDMIMRYKEKTDHNDKSSKYYNNGLYTMLRENDGWNNLKWIYEAEIEIPITYTKEVINELTSNIIMEYYNKHDSNVYDNKDDKKYICDCVGLFTIKTKTRHEKTKLHQEHIKDI
jgi:hypothetical protein